MLLDHFFPPDVRVEKEARTLLKAGNEVFLLSLGKDDTPDEELLEGIRVIRKALPQGFLKRAWNFFWFSAFFIHPFWKGALIDSIKQYQIQALHIHDLPMVKTGLSVAKKFSIPIIADLHENYPEAIKVWGRDWKGKLPQPVWRWKQIERFCVQQADRVIVVVDEAKQHYVSDCGIPSEKVTVVMNTEDLDYFHSLPIKEDIVKKYQPYFTISYVGGFGCHRGIQTAISAMPRILSTIPQAKLLLVGSGGNEAKLKEQAKQERIEKEVEFTGWQSFALVPSYIAAGKICPIPHIASGHTNSTIPHKIFQAMAMGKPVIVSSVKPLERIIKETGAGLVYPSENAQALAEAVIRIYQDGALATRLGEAGKRAVKKRYNWEAEGKKLVTLYQDLEESAK